MEIRRNPSGERRRKIKSVSLESGRRINILKLNGAFCHPRKSEFGGVNYVTYKLTAFQLQVKVKVKRMRQLLLLALLAHASM